VFTRGDDSSQRLYYYLCELRRRGFIAGPEPLMFDVAQIPRASSIAHNRQALTRLLDQLAIDPQLLAAGRLRANAQRELFARLDLDRCGPGHRYEHIARASLFADLGPALQQATFTDDMAAPCVLLAGSSPPDDRFHCAIEAVGWNVGGDSYHRALRRYGAPLATDCDALSAMASHLNQSCQGPRAFVDRTATLLDDIKLAQARAVVLWLTEEDEALAWSVAQQRQALAHCGVPALVLTRRRWDGSDGAAEAMQQFLREQTQ